jgi:nitrite reductase/ring-hydroxylating ferredoxin subunit
VNGAEIAVSRVAGTLHAFSDICTHRGCNLSLGGEIDGSSITCECHGSVFDMTSGEVLEGPATEPIATFPVRDENGDLQIAT